MARGRPAGRFGLLLMMAMVAAGCRSAEVMAPAAPPPVSAPLRAYVFECDGGTGFVLAPIEGSTTAGEAADLILPGRRYHLPRVPAASGVHYAAAGVSVWNTGRQATLALDGQTSHCVENRARSIIEDARARGVEFRATGNEPGWLFELFADRLVFIEAYGANRVTTPRPSRLTGSAAGEELYVAVTEAHRLSVRIRPVQCTDTMSGDGHAVSVEVELDGKAYRGCGDPLTR